MLQVWKTYMGRNRDATTVGAIRSIYQEAGGGFPGISAFWAGTGPKVSKAIRESLPSSCRVMQSLLEPSMLLRGCWPLHSLTQRLCPLQMVESASKGMILMYAKEAILKVLNKAEVNPGAPFQLLVKVQRSLCL